MGKTIRAKAMRAWGLQCHVEVRNNKSPFLNGVISEFHSDRLYLKGHEWCECYYYHDITDIRFLDEATDTEDPRLKERQEIIERQRKELSEEHGKVLDLMQQVGSLENRILALIREITEDKPKEPENDVAKERWEYNRPGYCGCIVMDQATPESYNEDVVVLARLDCEAIGSPKQGRLMAAAPELADHLRKVINNDVRNIFDMASLLRKIGVPDVRPHWEETDKTE